MTKREAALRLLGVARSISQAQGGEDDADVWVTLLLSIAEGLDPSVRERRTYGELVGAGESREVKLRRLIERAGTEAERNAASSALRRAQTKRRGW